jgi:hypothetical protein
MSIDYKVNITKVGIKKFGGDDLWIELAIQDKEYARYLADLRDKLHGCYVSGMQTTVELGSTDKNNRAFTVRVGLESDLKQGDLPVGTLEMNQLREILKSEEIITHKQNMQLRDEAKAILANSRYSTNYAGSGGASR